MSKQRDLVRERQSRHLLEMVNSLAEGVYLSHEEKEGGNCKSDSWRDMFTLQMCDKLDEESFELKECLRDNDTVKAFKEALDVINVSKMIAAKLLITNRENGNFKLG